MSNLINIRVARLHSALFAGRTNLTDMIDMDLHKYAKSSMVYDRTEKELLITHNGETLIVPVTNIASMVEGARKHEEHKVEAPKGPITAQVNTPQQHVFAGHGHGKTGRDK